VATGESTGLAFSTGMAFHARPRHWPGQVQCLHAADHHDV